MLELLDGIRFETLPPWAKRSLHIFLASSAELRPERDAFELHLSRQRDTPVQIVRWETADASMSRTRSQDEYNKLIRDCDIFVCLVFTKAGRYTVEEFNTAHEQFVRSGRPAIYTFFKDAAIQAGAAHSDDFNSRRDFQKKLDGLGHFYSTFKSTEDLLLQFTEQLKKQTRSVPM